MSGTHLYRASGLVLASEIALPGLIPIESADEPDARIAEGNVPSALDAVLATGPTWQRGAKDFLLEIPDIARFYLSGGRTIVFERAAGVADRDVAIFLAGNVFGILLHQRCNIVLHASTIVVGGKAVLFCGASGAGKSTLAAALGERGYPLLTDDQAAIRLDDAGRPTVQPDGRCLRLWERSIDALGLDDRRGEAMRAGLEKFFVDPLRSEADPIQIGAIYFLMQERPPHRAGIEPANLVEAAQLLVANAYRPMLIRRMGQREAYFRMGATIASDAGLFFLTRPFRFDAMDETIAGLERHWAEIGLADPGLISEARRPQPA
ncbi:hypothetical protein [Sphingomonas immobilis]|uniref:Hpr(Ser) kinase/phosphatase n=1 Tax=Sphingomonas immobilis TaxID=3063997 RepID=A0ABT8ZZY5_9SPHN|nr:hypothetical protein [Sphingomonas sp. CA1-15]MDO7843148.1 hypothetical protein [Sphingomonas sp. CA1-15]